jgi:hypothetical protein
VHPRRAPAVPLARALHLAFAMRAPRVGEGGQL